MRSVAYHTAVELVHERLGFVWRQNHRTVGKAQDHRSPEIGGKGAESAKMPAPKPSGERKQAAVTTDAYAAAHCLRLYGSGEKPRKGDFRGP